MRQLTVTDAAREAAKAKVSLSGGPGFGKTWTALSIARVLSPDGIVMVIDTEHESALLYSPPPGREPGPGEFRFKHTAWEAPYAVGELTEAIGYYAPHVDVLIIDSLSHFWQGEGGVLDMAAGKFSGWKDARPAHRKMVEAIVRAPCHLIGCMRSKVEFAQETDQRGKQVVRRLGMADVQDDGIAYEFTVTAELDAQHRLTITKTRCRDLALGRVFDADHETDMAATLLGWLNAGGAQDPAGPEVPTTPSGLAAPSTLADALAEEGERDRPRRQTLAASAMRAAQQEAGDQRRRLDQTTETSGTAGGFGEGPPAVSNDHHHQGGEDHVTDRPANEQEAEAPSTGPETSDAGAAGATPPAAPAARPMKELLAALKITPYAAVKQLRDLGEEWHDLRSTKDVLALEGDRAERAITLLEQAAAPVGSAR